jgi:glycosyltransferase involved in cell wall biosynthesis
LAALLADKLASTQKAKVNVLYNGYDSDKMAGLPAYAKSNKFIISFIGILSDSQPINAFVDGLRLFFMDVDDSINNVEFHSAGEVSNGIEQNLLQVMPATRIIKHGYLPHQKALAQMSASDLLFNSLAEMPESKLLISGKLMEYLASGRPVLCLGDTSGDAANLLNKFERSAIFARNEAEKIAAFIKDIYLLWQKNENGSIVRPGIEEYSRRAVTQKLATLIKTSEQ